MTKESFASRVRAGEHLVGMFVKTPAHEVVELLALAGLDFVCLDAEHGPFDRGRLDLCLAMARALGLPCLVRIAEAGPAHILQALDSGAAGVVVPHVSSVDEAKDAARWARYGDGGRGYAGSTRWAGYTGRSMAENVARSRDETIVIAQIEDAAALDHAAAIAALPGIDALFVGAADLAVSLGVDGADPAVEAGFTRIATAARDAGKALAAFAGGAQGVAGLRQRGVTMPFVGSEQSLILAGARAVAAQKSSG